MLSQKNMSFENAASDAILLSENSCKKISRSWPHFNLAPRLGALRLLQSMAIRQTLWPASRWKAEGFLITYWQRSTAGAPGGFGSVLHGTENLCYARACEALQSWVRLRIQTVSLKCLISKWKVPRKPAAFSSWGILVCDKLQWRNLLPRDFT